MIEAFQYVAGSALVLGALFALLASIGLLRFPDIYTRMHASSLAGSVGTGLIFISIMLVSVDGAVSLRATIGIVFLLLTIPVSAHLLAKSAYFSGHLPSEATKNNDLQRLTEIEL